MINMNIIRDVLNNFVNDDDTDSDTILLIYLFGSVLNSILDIASDIDLAFLLKSDEYRRDPIYTSYPAYHIASNIGIKLNKKTDVIILNSSSLEIAYEIIKTGTCVYKCDVDFQLEYEAKIRGMYFDFKPFLLDLRAKRLKSIMRETADEIGR